MALLFLLMIVCFPLFLLPMMLSRFARVGWSGLRSASAGLRRAGTRCTARSRA
jgi:hypothetical protein